MSRLLPPELSNQRQKERLVALLLLVRESEVKYGKASISLALAVTLDILDHGIAEDSLTVTGLAIHLEVSERASFPSSILVGF